MLSIRGSEFRRCQVGSIRRVFNLKNGVDVVDGVVDGVIDGVADAVVGGVRERGHGVKGRLRGSL